MPPTTLFERLFDEHVVAPLGDDAYLLQIDRHVLQEVSSAAAFEQLRARGRRVAAPAQTFATQDHIVSTAPGRSARSAAMRMRSPAIARIRSFIRDLRRCQASPPSRSSATPSLSAP